VRIKETRLLDIEKRRADRLRVMKAIFDASSGSEDVFVSGPELLENLGLSDQELGDACKYLEGEHLISTTQTMWGHLTPYMIQITHWGIKEMEQSLTAPSEPTQHFPPAISVINVHGSVIGSAIQSASPGARQEVSTGDLDLGAVREFVGQYEARAADLDLPSPAAEELAAEIDTVKAQLRSPKPKHHVIRESLHSARAILEVATGGATAVGLLDLLQHIRL
jgi:hypothetical protein